MMSVAVALVIATAVFPESVWGYRSNPHLRGKRLAPLNERNGTDQLVFVQSLFRHGERSPEAYLPFENHSIWPMGLGELTVRGMEQPMELGRKLRAKYVDTHGLLSQDIRLQEVRFRSSDRNRTLMSALANIAGFFEGAKTGRDYPANPNWPQGFVPVPVHTVEWTTDTLFNHRLQCPRLQWALQMLRDSPEFVRLLNETEPLLSTLSEIANYTVVLEKAYLLWDIWRCHRVHNFPLPATFTEELYQQLEDLDFYTNDLQFGVGIQPYDGVDVRKELTRLRGGTFLGTLISNMQQKADCLMKQANSVDEKFAQSCEWIHNLKYYAFSGHDTTIEVLFSAFGFNTTNAHDVGEPKYAACLTFELWRRPNDEFYVKVLYWPPELGTFDITDEIVGCDSECALERFAQRSEPYVVNSDYQTACKLDPGTEFSAISSAVNSFFAAIPIKIWPEFIAPMLGFVATQLRDSSGPYFDYSAFA